MSAIKTVFIEPSWKARSTEDLTQFPPDGYRFIAPEGRDSWILKHASKWDYSYKLLALAGSIIDVALLKSRLDKLKAPPKEACLTYSLCHVVLRKEPWILDMLTELPCILAWRETHLRRHREQVREILLADNCRQVICRVEKGRQAFLAAFGDDLAYKVKMVSWGTQAREFCKDHNSDRVKILFVNSGNINTATHFFNKGGAEVVQAFIQLSKKYNNIDLILRSGMPKSLVKEYSQIENVKVIADPIPWQRLEMEWETSDIFVIPSHINTASQTFLDAMSFELPIIATDTWANSEFVEDGETGFLVHNPRSADFEEGPFLDVTNPKFARSLMQGPEPSIVEGLVDRISTLIDNPGLRRRMGKTARQRAEVGRQSLAARNEQLGAILDKVTIELS